MLLQQNRAPWVRQGENCDRLSRIEVFFARQTEIHAQKTPLPKQRGFLFKDVGLCLT